MDVTSGVVIVLAAIPIVAAYVACAMNKEDLGIVHIHLLFLTLSYGAYTILDVAVNGSDNIDLAVVAALMIAISLVIVVTTKGLRLFGKKTVRVLRLREFIIAAGAAPFSAFSFFWLAFIAWRIYLYISFGIVSYYNADELAQQGLYLPRLLGPISSLLDSIGFSVSFYLVASLSSNNRRTFLVMRFAMLIIIVLLLSLSGRRTFMSLILVSWLTWGVARQRLKSMFSIRGVAVGAVMLVAVSLFSNFFQEVRLRFLTLYLDQSEITEEFRPVKAIFDFNATIENLAARTALWRFHYRLMKAQLEDVTDVMGGTILVNAIFSSIPKVFITGKVVASEDVMVCNYYTYMCSGDSYVLTQIDLPQTMYSGVQADFGLLFVIVAPMFVLMASGVVAVIGGWAKFGRVDGWLYVMVYGITLAVLVNVEQSVGNYFLLLRDVGIMVAFWFVTLLFGRRRSTPVPRTGRGSLQAGGRVRRMEGTRPTKWREARRVR